MAESLTDPSHYKGKKFSPWEVIEEFFPNRWHFGAAFKYLSRAGKKLYPGCDAKESELYDTRKAIAELQRHEELLADEIDNQNCLDRVAEAARLNVIPLRQQSWDYDVDNDGKHYEHSKHIPWGRPKNTSYFLS